MARWTDCIITTWKAFFEMWKYENFTTRKTSNVKLFKRVKRIFLSSSRANFPSSQWFSARQSLVYGGLFCFLLALHASKSHLLCISNMLHESFFPRHNSFYFAFDWLALVNSKNTKVSHHLWLASNNPANIWHFQFLIQFSFILFRAKSLQQWP